MLERSDVGSGRARDRAHASPAIRVRCAARLRPRTARLRGRHGRRRRRRRRRGDRRVRGGSLERVLDQPRADPRVGGRRARDGDPPRVHVLGRAGRVQPEPLLRRASVRLLRVRVDGLAARDVVHDGERRQRGRRVVHPRLVRRAPPGRRARSALERSGAHRPVPRLEQRREDFGVRHRAEQHGARHGVRHAHRVLPIRADKFR